MKHTNTNRALDSLFTDIFRSTTSSREVGNVVLSDTNDISWANTTGDPVSVKQQEVFVSQLGNDLANANTLVTQAMSDVANNAANVANVANAVTASNANIANVQANVAKVQANVANVSNTVSATNANLANVQSNLVATNANVSNVANTVTATNANIANVQANVANAISLANTAATTAANALSVANLAQAAAAGLVSASIAAPTSPPTGAIWFPLDNNGNVIGMKLWNGSAWTSYVVMADQFVSPGSLGTVSIANSAVTAPIVAANAITVNAIAANAVTANAISANAITAGKIAAGAVIANAIAANAVTAVAIQAGAVTANAVAANAISALAIQARAVTANAIAANAVTANAIAANSITSAMIQAGSVIANAIGANAVTAAAIQAGAVTANAIGANAVTAGKIAANAVTANAIAANAVTANTIQGDAINGMTITGAKLVGGSVSLMGLSQGAVTNTWVSDDFSTLTKTSTAFSGVGVTSDGYNYWTFTYLSPKATVSAAPLASGRTGQAVRFTSSELGAPQWIMYSNSATANVVPYTTTKTVSVWIRSSVALARNYISILAQRTDGTSSTLLGPYIDSAANTWTHITATCPIDYTIDHFTVYTGSATNAVAGTLDVDDFSITSTSRGSSASLDYDGNGNAELIIYTPDSSKSVILNGINNRISGDLISGTAHLTSWKSDDGTATRSGIVLDDASGIVANDTAAVSKPRLISNKDATGKVDTFISTGLDSSGNQALVQASQSMSKASMVASGPTGGAEILVNMSGQAFINGKCFTNGNALLAYRGAGTPVWGVVSANDYFVVSGASTVIPNARSLASIYYGTTFKSIVSIVATNGDIPAQHGHIGFGGVTGTKFDVYTDGTDNTGPMRINWMLIGSI